MGTAFLGRRLPDSRCFCFQLWQSLRVLSVPCNTISHLRLDSQALLSAQSAALLSTAARRAQGRCRSGGGFGSPDRCTVLWGSCRLTPAPAAPASNAAPGPSLTDNSSVGIKQSHRSYCLFPPRRKEQPRNLGSGLCRCAGMDGAGAEDVGGWGVGLYFQLTTTGRGK